MKRTAIVAAAMLLAACGGEGGGPDVEISVPSGAAFIHVVDTLEARGLVSQPLLFRIYARLKKAEGSVRSGRYVLREGDGWGHILDDLVSGRVVTVALTIPEGFTLRQIAPRIAELSGVDVAEVEALFSDRTNHDRWGVPGPGLEGYLFPDTYRFASGVPVEVVIREMVDRYHAYWTPARRARLEATGFTEGELVTLASVIQAEARRTEEMPRISSVYTNRVRRGWRLEADPTVLYALGGPRERLLYAAIDSVADHPYNTYRQEGLPPGPIGAPGALALDAALSPADEPFMFFVAHPDGFHTFTRTLAEHNRAKAASARIRRQRTSDRPSF